MKRFTVACLLAIIATTSAVQDNCIEVYWGAGFIGGRGGFCGAANMATIPSYYHNQISSVRVANNIGVVTYFDATNFGGNSLKLSGHADIDKLDPVGFNDAIRSIHYNWLSLPTGMVTPPKGCIWVFQDAADYHGRGTELCQDTADLSLYDFDNQVSSIKLGPGVARVRLYANAGFAGSSYDVSAPVVENLGSVRFDNVTSSIQIFTDYQVVCPSGGGQLQCSGSDWISIVSATYGRTSTSDCGGPGLNTSCQADATAYLSALCNGKQSCNVNADNFHVAPTLGDPCVNNLKNFGISYVCLPPETPCVQVGDGYWEPTSVLENAAGASSWHACDLLCQNDPNCNAYTFRPRTHSSLPNTCQLLGGASETRYTFTSDIHYSCFRKSCTVCSPPVH